MIVLDANVLIRAVLGRRVRQLIETYAARGVSWNWHSGVDNKSYRDFSEITAEGKRI